MDRDDVIWVADAVAAMPRDDRLNAWVRSWSELIEVIRRIGFRPGCWGGAYECGRGWVYVGWFARRPVPGWIEGTEPDVGDRGRVELVWSRTWLAAPWMRASRLLWWDADKLRLIADGGVRVPDVWYRWTCATDATPAHLRRVLRFLCPAAADLLDAGERCDG